MSSIAWLETYLLNYRGAVLIVAHDRYFLDKIVSKVIELDNGHAVVYSGNYTAYSEKRAQMRAIQMKAYLNQQQEIKHQEAVIEKLKSFNREKSIKRAESREKMLDKIEVLEKPTEVNDAMDIRLEPNILSGNDVLTVNGLAKSFGSQTLFTDLSFDVKRGERVAIIGDNGTGKTTILKIINGLVEPDDGEIILGSRVHIGYYDQDHQVLHMEKTLFEEISDAYPGMSNTQIRSTLAAFLFTGDDVFKRIGDLSGGERGRVSLAKLMLSEANFLILDEPTNHLDMRSKDVLKEAIREFDGTVILVSHDRDFLDGLATKVYEFGGGLVKEHIGGIYDFLQKKKMESLNELQKGPALSTSPTGVKGDSISEEESPSDNKLSYEAQKELNKKIKKLERRVADCEETIEQMEAAIAILEEKMATPEGAANMALYEQHQKLKQQLDRTVEEWEKVSMELEEVIKL